DLIIEARLAVVGDDAKLAFRFRRHCRSPQEPASQPATPPARRPVAAQSGGHLLCAFNTSRISMRSSSCLVGPAGLACSARVNRFISLTTMNSTQAIMMKLITIVRKLPQAKTAPCFFASTNESAVTLDESGMK